ncbi:low affinity immunoglobulin gamma Fc region receptor II-like [Anabas testudineus]|uniref:low affinity immunoglobulin gamma Fc region receptor II-like n=1 Tax=Anabas testudineus TaxID=64144 RepID=UPI000E457B18|nr:low affinity immunoglobulin gamma Fc region receptor II-like [Anabas testudineus]
MEVTALCIKLLMTVIMLMCDHDQKVNAASLRVDRNRAQFFEYESITFYYEGVSYCEVVHESKGKISLCNKTNERTATGSSCTVTNVYVDDSGEYWFDAEGGKRSNSVNITVTTGSVILEIPALPVMEGEAVTLRCRNKTTSSQTSAHFYQYGDLISNSSTGNMIIHNVSKSDEGLYKCSISGAGESAESRLSIGDGQKETSSFKETVNSSYNFTLWIIIPVKLVALVMLLGPVYLIKVFWHRVNESVESTSTSTTTYDAVTRNSQNEVHENVESTSISTTTYAAVTKNRKNPNPKSKRLKRHLKTTSLEPAVSRPSADTNPS